MPPPLDGTDFESFIMYDEHGAARGPLAASQLGVGFAVTPAAHRFANADFGPSSALVQGFASDASIRTQPLGYWATGSMPLSYNTTPNPNVGGAGVPLSSSASTSTSTSSALPPPPLLPLSGVVGGELHLSPPLELDFDPSFAINSTAPATASAQTGYSASPSGSAGTGTSSAHSGSTGTGSADLHPIPSLDNYQFDASSSLFGYPQFQFPPPLSSGGAVGGASSLGPWSTDADQVTFPVVGTADFTTHWNPTPLHSSNYTHTSANSAATALPAALAAAPDNHTRSDPTITNGNYFSSFQQPESTSAWFPPNSVLDHYTTSEMAIPPLVHYPPVIGTRRTHAPPVHSVQQLPLGVNATGASSASSNNNNVGSIIPPPPLPNRPHGPTSAGEASGASNTIANATTTAAFHFLPLDPTPGVSSSSSSAAAISAPLPAHPPETTPPARRGSGSGMAAQSRRGELDSPPSPTTHDDQDRGDLSGDAIDSSIAPDSTLPSPPLEENTAVEGDGTKRKRMYGCMRCHKIFDRPSTLRKHEVVHTNRKDFACEYCGQLFNVRSNLNRHLKCCKARPPVGEDVVQAGPISPVSPLVLRHPPGQRARVERVTVVNAEASSSRGVVVPSIPPPGGAGKPHKRQSGPEPSTSTQSEPESAAVPHSRTRKEPPTSSSSSVAASTSPPTDVTTPKPKRTRRTTAPSERWIPASLANFDLSGQHCGIISVPLPPVRPYRIRVEDEWPDKSIDELTNELVGLKIEASGDGHWIVEERDSYDENVSPMPYHPAYWKGRLPGPKPPEQRPEVGILSGDMMSMRRRRF